ncbi:MAG: hypothetical protein EB127_28025 [Alphaproteobacteria bacterium]|jgi:hypothetical protein|nr:hypothetical protein [Alphaproteobacteria bacterium]
MSTLQQKVDGVATRTVYPSLRDYSSLVVFSKAQLPDANDCRAFCSLQGVACTQLRSVGELNDAKQATQTETKPGALNTLIRNNALPCQPSLNADGAYVISAETVQVYSDRAAQAISGSVQTAVTMTYVAGQGEVGEYAQAVVNPATQD